MLSDIKPKYLLHQRKFHQPARAVPAAPSSAETSELSALGAVDAMSASGVAGEPSGASDRVFSEVPAAASSSPTRCQRRARWEKKRNKRGRYSTRQQNFSIWRPLYLPSASTSVVPNTSDMAGGRPAGPNPTVRSLSLCASGTRITNGFHRPARGRSSMTNRLCSSVACST
jgi:hypothetical protein